MNKPLTVDEAAEYLSLAKTYMYKLVCMGKITAYKPGGKRLYFRVEDLDKFVFQNCRSASGALAERAEEFLNR